MLYLPDHIQRLTGDMWKKIIFMFLKDSLAMFEIGVGDIELIRDIQT